MSSELSDKVSNLVDLLRGKDHDDLAMADIAMVTEVLISTMQRYFSSIDTQIYREFRELATYIEDAKAEKKQLKMQEARGGYSPPKRGYGNQMYN